MILRHNETGCLAAIASIDAERGYPRTFTQADVDSGDIVRHGAGRHVPFALLTVQTTARPKGIDFDADGLPTGARRLVRIPVPSTPERALIAEARVLRLINEGTAGDLEAVNGINATKSAQIIAGRPWASVDALPANLLGSLNSYRSEQESIDEDLVTAADAPPGV